MFTSKEQLCQSIWQSVKKQKFKAKKIEGGQFVPRPPLKDSREKIIVISHAHSEIWKFHRKWVLGGAKTFKGFFLESISCQNYETLEIPTGAVFRPLI